MIRPSVTCIRACSMCKLRVPTLVDLQVINRLLQEHGGPIAAIIGRYHGVYNHIRRPYHWDNASSGGVIVEQVAALPDSAGYAGRRLHTARRNQKLTHGVFFLFCF